MKGCVLSAQSYHGGNGGKEINFQQSHIIQRSLNFVSFLFIFSLQIDATKMIVVVKNDPSTNWFDLQKCVDSF